MNGDGLSDLLVGADQAEVYGTRTGIVYVVWGKADSAPLDLAVVQDGDGGWSALGAHSYGNAGWSLAPVDDRNGRGRLRHGRWHRRARGRVRAGGR